MIVKDIIERLTELLYSGSKEFYYKGHRFEIEEYLYSNPVEFTSYTRISIKVPVYLSSHYTRTFQDIYSATYEEPPDELYTSHVRRVETCARLAREFVTVALLKIDYEIEKELHNQKIQEILDVLE